MKEGKNMKAFIKEFKEFISRGNVLDMAVGVIIGGAFTSIVKSLVDDIINPFLGLFGGMNFDLLTISLGKDNVLYYGRFLTAVINFLIMALIVFVIIKMINRFGARWKKQEIQKKQTKICPYCQSQIHIDAKKCPYCTSTLQ